MVNAQAERVFGYDRKELLDQPIEMLVPERFRSAITRACAARSSQARCPGPWASGRDLYGLKKDGSEFPIEIGLNPIETDEGPMVLSAIVDISSRKRLEERFRQVVESAPNAMVMINRDRRDRDGQRPGREGVRLRAQRAARAAHRDAGPGAISQGTSRVCAVRSFRARYRGPWAPVAISSDLKKDGSEFPIEIGLNPIETDEGRWCSRPSWTSRTASTRRRAFTPRSRKRTCCWVKSTTG